MATGRRKAWRSISEACRLVNKTLLRGTDAASEDAMIKLARLLAAVVLASSVATPAFADGRNKRPHVTAKAPPPLRIPEAPPPVPPLAPSPTPIKMVPPSITLPSDFGSGGVGVDINGGGGGGGRVIVIANASSSARSYASATAVAYASATAISFGGGKGHGGGGGGGHGCGCK